jgi:glycosyltransferase involved in cell wall biosynthesis
VEAFKPANYHQPRVLHYVGHLLRGGIEKWLFQFIGASKDACVHHVLVRTTEEEPFTSAFRELGVPVLTCADYKSPLHYAKRLRDLVDTNGPYDIVHVHGSSFSGLLTVLFAKLVGIPRVIVHSHNDVRPHLADRGIAYRIYVTMVLGTYQALADHGFAASVLAAESMFGEDWREDNRWELLYYGVDCRSFRKPRNRDVRRQLSLPPEAFVIGHIGRFHEQKNHLFLVDIIEAAALHNSHVHCLLIGDGPLRRDVTREIARRHLSERFTFVPDTDDIADYLKDAIDCFVFPSRYEGLGLVVVEAQAAGVPSIISDRVPAEAVVTQSLVRVLSLDDSTAVWADAALATEHRSFTQPDALSQVESSLFSFDRSTAQLQGRYLQVLQHFS